ncbi:hypothetical protein FSARC_2242 [Fusarium sarcochroum]|uniref:Uncharacterized protein n=1 Tax=Fusarium sarcochroum TaxID=1208366 RepID=A0A8H4U6V1_9HYPO|nr:hypothetical protein FSARC_2242 [Fusarium sarcochroum]
MTVIAPDLTEKLELRGNHATMTRYLQRRTAQTTILVNNLSAVTVIATATATATATELYRPPPAQGPAIAVDHARTQSQQGITAISDPSAVANSWP